jgi:hypothetical protein
MQRRLPVDALNVFGTTGVLAGVFLGRFIAVRVPMRQPNPQNPIGTNT